MKKLTVILLMLKLAGCMKLDNNLYNNTDKISAYRFDQYDGEQDFVLDNTYAIAADKMQLFELSSKKPGEAGGVSIQVLYLGETEKIKTDTVIVYCHGNKWHMDFYWQRAKLLAHINGKHTYGVLMMDYRGYGLSGGAPDEDGLSADVNACLEWLKSKGLSSDRLVMYGFSLGSAPACDLTANPGPLVPSKLILEAPFASAAVMVQDAAQLNMPAEYFTNLKLDNAEEIKKIQQPFLWLHGDSDNFLNYKTHGEVVYRNYAGVYSEKYIVEGADHGEVPEKMGFGKYMQVTGSFIRK